MRCVASFLARNFLAVGLGDLHMLKCEVYVEKSAMLTFYTIQLPETKAPELQVKYFI